MENFFLTRKDSARRQREDCQFTRDTEHMHLDMQNRCNYDHFRFRWFSCL